MRSQAQQRWNNNPGLQNNPPISTGPLPASANLPGAAPRAAMPTHASPTATGTISGNVYSTVVLGSSNYASTLTVTSTGVVHPATYGANAIDIPTYTANASLTNYGVIEGANNPGGAGGIGVYVGGTGAMITNAGQIHAGNVTTGQGGVGIDVSGSAATITNTGTITGGYGSAGVLLAGAGALLDNATNTYTGQVGSIDSYYGPAVLATGSNETIENAGFLGRDSKYGVSLAGNGDTLSNSGSIFGSYRGAAVLVKGQDEVVSNAGVIENGDSGVAVDLTAGSSSTFENSGAIVGGANDGGAAAMYAAGNNTVIINRGNITGGYSDVTGVIIASAGTTVENFGNIFGGSGIYHKYYGGLGGVAVELTVGGTLVNSGTIGGGRAGGYNGDGGVGIILTNGVVNNSGQIFGAGGNDSYYRGSGGGNGAIGVVVSAGGTLTNSGTISGGGGGYALHGGGSGAAAVYMKGGSVVNTGVILGGIAGGGNGHHRGSSAAGVVLDGGTLTNAGTITGGGGTDAVYCGAAAVTLIVEAGAVFNGGVVGNSHAADVLIFGGSTAGTSSGLGSEFSGFTTIDIATGANWTFANYNTVGSSETLNVAGTMSVTGTLTDAAPILNTGTITADGIVILDGAITSSGMLRASDGGTLNLAKASLSGLSNGTFSGGTLRADTNSLLQLSNNSSIVTDSGNITLDGAGSVIESLDTANQQQITLDSTLDAISAHGTLSITGSRNFTATANAGTFSDAGKLVIEAVTFSAAQLTITAAGVLTGYGKIVGPVSDSGVLQATKRALDLTGSLSVTGGTLMLGAGSEIQASKGLSFTTVNGNPPAKLMGPGTLLTTSPTSIAVGNTLSIGDSANWDNSGKISDAGTIQLNLVKNDTLTIVNNAGASFNLTADTASITWSGSGLGADTLSNAGIFAKTGGTGTSTVDLTMTNSGTVTAASGTLLLKSSVTNSGLVVTTGGATIDMSAGQVTNTGSIVAASGTLLVQAAVTNGAMLVADTGSMFDISGSLSNTGTLDAAGGTVNLKSFVTNTGMLLANDGSTINFTGGTLTNLSGTTLLGGTLRANTSSTIQLANNVSIATDQANITLSGAGATIESLDTATSKMVLLDNTLSSIAAGGTLSVVSGRNFTATANAGTFTNGGQLILQAVDFTATSLVNAAGATLSGFATVQGAVVNAGQILASKGEMSFLGAISNTGTITASAETLSCSGKVTGAGMMIVGQAGTLSLLQGAGALQTIDFQSGGALLDLGAPMQFNAQIAGFGTGGAIDLLGTPATALSYANNVLTVENGAQTVASLAFQGSYETSSFTLTTDGAGGALIKFV